MTTFDKIVDINHIHIGNDPSATNSPFGYMGYRPNYADYQSSGLAGPIFSLEHLFPYAHGANKRPVCHMLTYEEDGFLKGKVIFEKADSGNHFNIFGSNIDRYGFAIQGCQP